MGHVRHLTQAGIHGQLIVAVTRDQFVNKAGRPIIPESERLEMVQSLRCVSVAALCDGSMDALETWKPKIFVKGHDYLTKGLLPEEREFCKKHDILIMLTGPNPQTTTRIVERCKSS